MKLFGEPFTATLLTSPPVRGRGLKHERFEAPLYRLRVAPPCGGRGLKRLHDATLEGHVVAESPPVRGRGLKRP